MRSLEAKIVVLGSQGKYYVVKFNSYESRDSVS